MGQQIRKTKADCVGQGRFEINPKGEWYNDLLDAID
jgi:hypothetical protein